MKKIVNLVMLLLFFTGSVYSADKTLTKAELHDKIMGGWAGQLIGCTFGGPTEFNFNSTIIPDYQPIEWHADLMQWWYDNAPGLYDDIYMDLTFVQVFEEKGLNAPASDFALAFANAEYSLWHANQGARYNILNGVMPPASGHWLHNPHADDIDFQIEADFAGLMSPGLVNAASGYCDKIGHIMNYGDGWYGGVYVAAMYSLAFVYDDVNKVVEEALAVIPQESQYYQCMRDVIDYHAQYPDDWKQCWFEIERKWGEDIGCPEGVFKPFNIDAKINSAWILLGLLYGEGDFGKTISISTRAGDDSDCNPASSGGILGAMLGYSNIPAYWKQGIDKVEDRDFKYTTISLQETYDMSFRQALQVIELNGGKVADDHVVIPVQKIIPVALETGFVGHYPVERRRFNKYFNKEFSFEFEGVGFTLGGWIDDWFSDNGNKDHVFVVEMIIDGETVKTSKLPCNYTIRKDPLFWRYQLQPGKHNVTLRIINNKKKQKIRLDDLVVYAAEPGDVKY